MAEGGQQFERLLDVRAQRWLAFDPRFRVRQGLEDAACSPERAIDDTPVDQEQQDDRSLVERHGRPVVRTRQVILEVEARVTDRLLEERDAMLVILVGTVMSELAFPAVGQVTNK